MALEAAASWNAWANCLGKDESLFFAKQNELTKIKQAKALCRNCAVRLECLEEALAFDDQPGVFGGTTENERSNIRLLLSAKQVSLRAVWNSLHP